MCYLEASPADPRQGQPFLAKMPVHARNKRLFLYAIAILGYSLLSKSWLMVFPSILSTVKVSVVKQLCPVTGWLQGLIFPAGWNS